MNPTPSPLMTSQFDGALFDLDGVLTATAKIHAACWKRMFDGFLKQRAEATGEPFVPFDPIADYQQYIDGKMRYVGVQSFLASRGITSPYGDPSDAPNYETVCGLGNFKDIYFDEVFHSQGIEVYEGSVALVRQLRQQGLKTAVVSSSHHCKAVLKVAEIEDCFSAVVDGNLADELHCRHHVRSEKVCEYNGRSRFSLSTGRRDVGGNCPDVVQPGGFLGTREWSILYSWGDGTR